MTDAPDLRTALGQIASGAAEAHTARRRCGDDLPVPAIRAAARRRRTRFEAAVGGAAAALIATAALAGSALGGMTDPEPAPPVEPAPHSPSPTPEPESTEWPAAVTLDGDVPECGDPMPAVLRPDGEPGIRVDAVVPGQASSGGLFITDHTVTVPDDVRETVVLISTQMLAVRDGVVAEVGPLMGGPLTEASPIQLDMVGCDGAPTPAGAYDLYALALLMRIGPDLELVEDDPLVAVGGPYPLMVEAPPDPHPPLEDLRVTTSGLGPLTVGWPAETNPGGAMIAFRPDACTVEGELYVGNPDRWEAAYDAVREFDYYGGDEMHPPFKVAVDDGSLARIDIWTDRITTEGGIHLGSTLEELLAAHPDVVEATVAQDWSRAWVLADENGTLVFETVDWYVPGADIVMGIRVFAPGTEPALHVTDTDDVAGTCF